MSLEQKLGTGIILLAPAVHHDHAAFQRALRRYDIIKSQGCTPFFLGCKIRRGYHGVIKDFCEFAEQRRPGSVLRIEDTGDRRYREELHAIHWPRDVFQVFDGLVCVNPFFKMAGRRILDALQVQCRECIESLFGDGGAVLPVGNIVIASKRLEHEPRKKIEDAGFSLHFLPYIPNGYHGADKDTVEFHLDPYCGLFRRGAGKVFLSSVRYYAHFGRELRAVAERINAEVEIIPDGGGVYAVNIPQLPNGVVLAPDVFVQEKLSGVFGPGRAFNVGMKAADFSGKGGGLRCMSNVIV